MKIAVVVSAVALAVSASASAAPTPGMSIFVIAGQSNAAGYGEPIPVERPNSRVFDLTHGRKSAMDPLGDAPGVGPGRYMGLYLAKRGMRVGLVNCAVGGSFLDSWLPGNGGWFEPCVALVQAATKYGHVVGVFFMQGESDEMSEDLASTWATRFAMFVGSMRAALASPTLPVVFGRVLDFTNCEPCGLPYGAIVHDQQTSVLLPGVAMVNADDLPHSGEHFTVPGYNVLGNRMAQAWLAVRKTLLP